MDRVAVTYNMNILPGWLQNLARNLVLKRLQGLQHGHLLIIEDDRRHGFGSATADEIQVTIHVEDPRFTAISPLAARSAPAKPGCWDTGPATT